MTLVHLVSLPHQAYSRRTFQAGFSLLELMIVLIVLALVAGMVVVGVQAQEKRTIHAFVTNTQKTVSMMRLYSAERGAPVALVLDNKNNTLMIWRVMLDTSNASLPAYTSKKNRMELSTAIGASSTPNVAWQPLGQAWAIPKGVRLEVQLPAHLPSHELLAKQGVRPWVEYLDSSTNQVLLMWYGAAYAKPAKVIVWYDDVVMGEWQVAIDGRAVGGGHESAQQ